MNKKVIGSVGIIGLLVALIIVFNGDTVIRQRILSAPEPETCSLCSIGKAHAPVLVCLSTGEAGELVVYNQAPTKGEILTDWDGGTFRFVKVGSFASCCDSWSQSNHCTIPHNRGIIDPEYYCSDCRKLLCDVATRGYVLVDCYDTQNMVAYPVRENSDLKIRGYSVSIKANPKEKSSEIVVTGNYMDGLIPLPE